MTQAFNIRGANDPIHEARTWLTLDPLFLDTETTGLEGQICEIAVLDKDGNELINTLVKPEWKMEAGARLVHKITDEMLEHAPTFADLWPQLETLLLGRHIIIYNSQFDIPAIVRSGFGLQPGITPLYKRAATLLYPATHNHVHCAMLLFAEFYGVWNAHYHTYKWQPLGVAARHFKIQAAQDHRARGDAEMCRQVILKLAEQEIISDKELTSEW